MPKKPETITESQLSDLVDFMISGYWVYDGLPPFSMETSGKDNAITVNVSGISATGKSLARDSLEAWEAVADISFREINSNAQINFAEAGARADTVFKFNAAETAIIGSTVTIGPGWLSKYGDTVGSFSFQTYIHEVGHALGLGHSGEYKTNVPTFPGGLLFDDDSWQVAVMSYYGQDRTPNIDATRASPITPQTADILALQEIYGAPDGTATAGDTIYGVNSNIDNFLGDYFREYYELNEVPPYDVTLTIADSGGSDTIDLSHRTLRNTVSLEDGAVSDIIGKFGNMIIMPGTIIENFTGGNATDIVFGNDEANILIGNGGSDQIFGGIGDDELQGDAGNDRIIAGAGDDELSGGKGGDILKGGKGRDDIYGGTGDDKLVGVGGDDIMLGDEGNDKLFGGKGIDELIGGTGQDVLKGAAGDDQLNGGGNHDMMFGGTGNDVMLGDTGNDRMSGGGGGDVMTGDGGIDNMSGRSGNDDMTGGVGNDLMKGGNGSDTMDGGEGGDDMTGGRGRDTMFSADGNDTISGNGGRDLLDGSEGHDILSGGGARDLMIGGLGNDAMTGGAGKDTFVYSAGKDTILDFSVLDTILFAADLFDGSGSPADQVMDLAEVVRGDIVIDFASRTSLTLVGFNDLSGLADQIDTIL